MSDKRRDSTLSAFTVSLFIACLVIATECPTVAQNGTAWPEADKLFRTDPRWLGSDAAFSIDLGDNHVLWLFGDTFVARRIGDSRKQAAFVRNTVAIQTGYDPSRADIRFYWRGGASWEIFPSEGKIWMWPAHGTRIGRRLIVFCSRVAPDSKKDSLGFQLVGWVAFAIDNPDDEPSVWKMRKIGEDHERLMLGSAVVRDSAFVYVFGESEPAHDIYLARWSLEDFQSPQLGAPEWWSGADWHQEKSTRQPVMRNVSSEISVQLNPSGGGFIEVNSQGFGATDVVMRSAPRLDGPWNAAKVIYRPPESNAPDVFVYAGKSHPELTGADLVVTYATNSNDKKLPTDMDLYFPRFVKIDLRSRGQLLTQ